jgi:hypothetical protein
MTYDSVFRHGRDREPRACCKTIIKSEPYAVPTSPTSYFVGKCLLHKHVR